MKLHALAFALGLLLHAAAGFAQQQGAGPGQRDQRGPPPGRDLQRRDDVQRDRTQQDEFRRREMERRQQWMTPEDRQDLRRDIRDHGRDVYRGRGQ